MPELPEVETIKRDLEKNIIGKKIVGADFLWPGILKDITPAEFAKNINGKKILGVERRAKNLYIVLEDNFNLLFHMKMTGHLIIVSEDWEIDAAGKWKHKEGKESPLYDPLNQYIRVVFHLDNDKKIAFSDLRKFAYLKVFKTEELKKIMDGYGPEPFSLEFTPNYLENVFKAKKTAVKKVLMDQTVVAGIGNIYADEILYAAKIHPLKNVADLTPDQIKAIYENARKILAQAIELRGTSVSDFRDTTGKKGEFEKRLKVYRRTGQPCYLDGTPIERIVVGGRGTHYCPKEQEL